MITSGQVQKDLSYRYTCNRCQGRNPDCPYCYGGDTTRITAAMKSGVKGDHYYGLLKSFLAVRGKDIAEEFKRIKAEQGSVVVVDLGYLSLKFGLNFKATVEWLEECKLLSAGAGRRIGTSLKVRDIEKAAREKYGELIA